MVFEIEPYTDHFTNLPHRHADSRPLRHQGQRRDIQGTQPLQALAIQHVARNVGDDGRKIPQLAVPINECRALCARSTDPCQLHE
jgi:hypothetical protein